MLRAGGRLCYSTCTFNQEENENVIEWFLKSFPDCRLVPFAIPLAEGEKVFSGMYRAYPHKTRGEGHFLALIEKRSEVSFEKNSKNRNKKNIKADKFSDKSYKDFFLLKDGILPSPNKKILNQLYYLPWGIFPVEGLKVLRYGLHLGEDRGNRFIPNHAFALSQQVPQAIERISLKEEEVKKIMLGQELDNKGKTQGWVLFAYHGIDFAWGKASGEMIKNHYPKGLRRTEGFFAQTKRN